MKNVNKNKNGKDFTTWLKEEILKLRAESEIADGCTVARVFELFDCLGCIVLGADLSEIPNDDITFIFNEIDSLPCDFFTMISSWREKQEKRGRAPISNSQLHNVMIDLGNLQSIRCL